MPEFKYADETEVKMSQLMTPEWANISGNVHGGFVLRLVDNIAYACGMRYAATSCVTAAVDRVDFYEAIHVGELLNLTARVSYVGRTSMEIGIDIFAENLTTGLIRHTNYCHFTMIAMRDGKPAPVPRLVCRTREDKALYIQAKRRRDMSMRYREERDEFMKQFADLDDQELDALIEGTK